MPSATVHQRGIEKSRKNIIVTLYLLRHVVVSLELAAAAALFICLTLFVQEENNLAPQFPFYCSICQNEGFFSF